jgi:hypothetical protein
LYVHPARKNINPNFPSGFYGLPKKSGLMFLLNLTGVNSTDEKKKNREKLRIKKKQLLAIPNWLIACWY